LGIAEVVAICDHPEIGADIRDTIQHWLVDKYEVVDELEFYPQERPVLTR